MSTRVLAILVLAASLLFAGVASGKQALDDQVREIASQLRCPVCQNLSVADSPSAMAQQMRGVIRDRLSAGQSPEEIEAYFVEKYGQWILLSPRRSGLNLVLWIGPFAAVVLGLLVAARLARRWTRPRPSARVPPIDRAVLELVRAEVADERVAASAGDPGNTSPLERERARLYEALREFAFDYRAGKLSAGDYEAMRAEYEARAAVVLLDLEAEAMRAGAEDRPQQRATRAEATRKVAPRWRPVRIALAGAFLVVFGLAVGVFLAQGIRPRAGSTDSITGDFLTGTGPGGMSPALSFRGNAVERQLAEGRAAFERQDFRMAIDHFKSVLAADPRNAMALSYLGAILWQAGHADAALETLERALATVPDHPLALWTKGNVLYQAKGDHAGAIRTWEALSRQPLAPGDTDTLARMLADARRQLASTARGAAERVTPPASGADDRRRIAGTVILADGVRPAAPVDGTLFVIARRGAGPPLAVKRILAPTFPLSFALGPDDVMVQGTELAGEVTLVARLKRDGRAGAATRGDLEGIAPQPVAVGTTDVRITLETVR
ncbi:MAG: cytochrome c-type biogenesis protein CcmH [Candidatus Rokubacteria bacterium]|nr:cytochrome c-type biogenesis protein CcmH [Candidatus Rokubacteria bacterium]